MSQDTPVTCSPHGQALVEIDDAIRHVVTTSETLRDRRRDPIQHLQLWEARGTVLARPIVADRDLPPFDRVAMDGFAFHAARASTPLRIIGEARAGTAFEGEVLPGQAVHVMTGTPLPHGADTVVPIEACRVQGDALKIDGNVTLGQHIATRGQDLRQGDVVAPAGRKIDAGNTGTLASVGATRVYVHRKARVCVMATGSELVPMTEVPGPAEIRDSNRLTLLTLAADAGANVVDGGLVPDEEAALSAAIRSAHGNDLIVFTGGVSKGEYDLVREAIEGEGGSVIFHGIAAKPGKPVLAAVLGDSLVLGLPGNPVSTLVMGNLLLVPAIRAMGRHRRVWPRHFKARLTGPIKAIGSRTTFLPGRLRTEGEAAVQPLHHNGSGDLTGFAAGDCLIRRPAQGEALEAGADVDVVMLQ